MRSCGCPGRAGGRGSPPPRTPHADDVLERVLEGAGLALLAREAAEGAGEYADVRRRDVAVDDEIGAVPLAPGLDVGGHAPDAEEGFRLDEQPAVLAAEPLARPPPGPPR